jgi:predicted O-linked N-acetylglucosamine transferase (SPINDLY family)
MGTPACDYILGDAVVTPFEDAAHYTEHIVQLPGSYQCNDNSRPEVPPSAERALHGLPAEAIVFAAFNNSYKINRTVFSSWMRILLQVPDSVLWLTCDDALARTNLWRNAERSGVSPERLVFAPRLPWAAHLTRMACADLLLDTWPYNAHTTASDALWAGVPVLTRAGRSFASRVASSLLISIGLPELICADETAYEAAAVQWASDRESLRSLRARLLLLKKESPLFDAHRFARNLEQAWTCMWYRHLCRLPPHAFAVRDVAEGGGVCWSDQTEWSPLPDLFSSLP